MAQTCAAAPPALAQSRYASQRRPPQRCRYAFLAPRGICGIALYFVFNLHIVILAGILCDGLKINKYELKFMPKEAELLTRMMIMASLPYSISLVWGFGVLGL